MSTNNQTVECQKAKITSRDTKSYTLLEKNRKKSIMNREDDRSNHKQKKLKAQLTLIENQDLKI